MIDSFPSPQLLPCCRLRPANIGDRRRILALTRRLHQAALPQTQWWKWVIWSLIGLAIGLFWQYPTLGIALTITSTPLWLLMLTVVWIIRQEQQQQCARYWVMEYDGQIIGCGRVDVHRQHSEIYDLFVLAEWRSCGIGQAIMQQLMAQATRPIYLASLPKAVAFYQRLGFKPIASQDLPWPLMHRLSLSNQCYRRARLQAMILQ